MGEAIVQMMAMLMASLVLLGILKLFLYLF